MRTDLWLAGLLVLAAACAGHPGPPDAERPAAPAAADVAVEPGASFRLRPGETASVAGGEWRVRFVGVRGDSRCPVDVECVWAGSAEVVVETAGPARPWSERSLHTGIEPRELRADGFTLALLEVEPPPRSTAPIDPARYIAVLRVDR